MTGFSASFEKSKKSYDCSTFFCGISYSPSSRLSELFAETLVYETVEEVLDPK